ncbi:HAMP domain-containing protein [Bosea sp. SSUT16]|uniref:histidine kinase n=1 Tax=Bosea spartocytisi TaxID=2773451 RepID=A0A927E4Z3_9HYPH|nr:ATP-binding protein [Bosea spartocytisi]MBD3844449.1 HAMP domain-containing protein [Bosea spartocytisi]MCT4470445.1 ATP-binding protein [Bosea spartocytisi]
MRFRMTTLRLRLVIGFMLVSVPAMLASAYVAAWLLSSAFEDNVEQWLGETSRFFRLEVEEASQEAQRVAAVIGQRIESNADIDVRSSSTFDAESALLNSVGYDVIAVYDDQRTIRYTSQPFQPITLLPTDEKQGIFKMTANGQRRIMAGAVQTISVKGQTLHVLVGSWLDEAYLGSIKVVTSLNVRLFADFGPRLEPVLETHPDSVSPVPQEIRRQLASGQEAVFDPSADGGTYRAVYIGFQGIDGELAAVAFVGLRSEAGLFEQLGRESLFLGIFLFGSLLSVAVGIVMSDILVRPLRALTRGVRAIAAGDYRQRVSETGGRELVQLAAGFNSMAEQLGALRDLETELRRRDRLSVLGQAAMVIAHEVRNPLGIIKTSTEVVRNRAKLAGSEDKMLGYVIDEVRRIETLVRDFLEFAHPKPPMTSELRMRSIIDRVAAIAGPELARHKISVAVTDESGDATVRGDPDQLHQACLNLVLNAIDAMPNGGTIHADVTAQGDTVSLTIRDEGAGVPAEMRDEIFNPFFTTKTKGTGLGLAKVQTVAEAHGGQATCASEPGRGAAFSITLPRWRSKEAP